MSDPLPVTIRLAAADDLDAVAAVWLAGAGAMDGRQDDLPAHGSLRTRIDDELAAGWLLYLALRDDRVVGMLALKPGEAILDQLFVIPEYWNSGIGTMLLDRAKRVMPDGFTLRMAAGNDRAARFYRRSGLSMVGHGEHPRSGQPVSWFRWAG